MSILMLILLLAPGVCAENGPKVWVESSEYLDASAFLATFHMNNTVDIRSIMYSINAGSTAPSCSRVYYLGPSSSGESELVGYKLVRSATHPDFHEAAEPLEDGIELISAPSPLAVVICDFISDLSTPSVVMTRSSSEEYPDVLSPVTAPTPHTLDQCHRSSFHFEAQQEISPEDIAAATTAAVSAVHTAFARHSPLNGTTTFFSFSSVESQPSIFRTCGGQRESSGDATVEDLVVSTLLANSPDAVVAAVVVPTIQQHLGPVAFTADTFHVQSGSKEDVGFKCASRTFNEFEPPLRSRCVYERCSSPPVFASEPQCYFGSRIVPDAECAFDSVVPPAQRDCAIGVTDVGLTSSGLNQEAAVVVRVYFDNRTDLHQDDFPLIQIEIDNFPGFEASTCLSAQTQGFDETGAQTISSVTCDITFSDNGMIINVAGNATHATAFVFTDDMQQGSNFLAPFSVVRVYLRRSKKLIYSNERQPQLDGVFEFNHETGKQELIFDSGYPGSWQEASSMLASATHVNVSRFDDFECTLAYKLGNYSSLFPTSWRDAVQSLSTPSFIASATLVDEMMIDASLSFIVRCIIMGMEAEVSGVRHSYLTAGSPGFTIKSVNLNSKLAVPRGHIGQLQFTVGDSDKSAAEIAESLAEALSYEGSIPTIAKLLNEGSVPSSGIFTVLFRVPPLTSFLLPSAEVLQAAFSNITGGAQLVLPGGMTSAADVSRTDLYSAVEEGVWQCGRDGSYGACELPAPNCGDSYATPLRCVQSESGTALDPETDPSAAIACGFDEQVLPTLPQSAGCGSFFCKVPGDNTDTFVPCDDARICISGCAVNVTVSSDVVAGNNEFRPVCVKDGIVQDVSNCLLSSLSYAPACNATSSCGTVCFAESTDKRVECTDTASWSECLDTCNGGLSTHFARCADTTVPVGDDAATEVPVSLCPGGVLNVELSTACPVDLSTCPGPTVTVETTSVESEYTITWDDANGKVDVAAQDNALVQLVPVPAEGSAAIVLGTVNATDYEFSFDAVAQNLLPGQYAAVVTLDGVLRGESEPFTVLVACSPACVNGTCNGSPGQCVCDAGFTGEDCSVSLCDVKQCNADTTEECSADTGVAVCKCKGAWSGERCEVSPCNTCSQEGGSCAVTDENTANCKCFTDNDGRPLFYGDSCDIPSNYCETHTPPCYHAGTRAGEFLNGAFVCTDCACTQSWDSATDCRTCGLPCAHGSAPDNECASCKCPITGGYSGSLCECRNAYVTFIIRDKDVDFDAVASTFERIHGDAANTRAVDQLSLLFATELASVTKIRVVNPTAAIKPLTSPSGVRYYEVALNVGPQCSGFVPVNDEHMISTYEGINSLKQFMSAGSHTAKSFVALSTAHVPSGFSANDPNCKLPGDQCPTGWNGNGKHIDADETQECAGANASNPECRGSTTKPDDDGLSTGSIVGIAVGGSVALIFILLLILWVAGIGCFAASKARRSTEVAMTSV